MFRCRYCGEHFLYRRHLSRHTANHKRSKCIKVQCSFCGKSVSRKNRKQHENKCPKKDQEKLPVKAPCRRRITKRKVNVIVWFIKKIRLWWWIISMNISCVWKPKIIRSIIPPFLFNNVASVVEFILHSWFFVQLLCSGPDPPFEQTLISPNFQLLE